MVKSDSLENTWSAATFGGEELTKVSDEGCDAWPPRHLKSAQGVPPTQAFLLQGYLEGLSPSAGG